MSEIKHVLYEDGIGEIFRLIVTTGNFAGIYDIVKPDGWDEVDSVIDINEDYFNVESFIIGKVEKIKILQYNDPVGYNLVKNVYAEQGGDGQILFQWIVDGIEPLGSNFELNLNKYNDGFEKSMLRIETELKKRESQSKLLNREDVTINLFGEKNIDQNDIVPVETFDIAYKKGDTLLSNSWFFSTGQFSIIFQDRTRQMYLFSRSDSYEFGNNTNDFAGNNNNPFQPYNPKPFLSTNISLKDVKLEFSNFNWLVDLYPGSGFVAVDLIIIIKNAIELRTISVESSVSVPVGGGTAGSINIANKIIPIGTLNPGESVFVELRSASAAEFRVSALSTDASIEITTNLSSALVKTQGVRLFNAIDQVVKNYTDSVLSLQSSILSIGGPFYNSSISTGAFLRGLPSVYSISDKLKTSFKSLFYEGSHPLMALGFDILNDKVLVENVDFFFKNIQVADLSAKDYLEENYSLEHDKDVSFNTLIFGSKKFSTKRKNDIKNFNTKLEATTPLITIKNKFEKQTEFIIDEYKIQELVEDKSSSTNDNDDDLVLIDLVEVSNFWDNAVFQDTQHYEEGGYLWLSCTSTPFDVTLIEVGNSVQITEGLNIGTWTVLEIVGYKMRLSKTTGITSGVIDTPLRYLITSAIKNRTTEGFNTNNIDNALTATNIRHNPKYNLARWFGYFASGLSKKAGSEVINITNYKNNAEAEMEILSSDMNNELQDVVITGADEPLARMRGFKRSYFNGKIIEITLLDVGFSEFLQIVKDWQFGLNEEIENSRGYITVPTPDGIFEIFPFGNKGFEHDKSRNELTLRGKVRGTNAPDPILLSVVQDNINTVTLVWDYSEAYINPTIQIRASLDGVNYTTIETVNNIKAHTFSSSFFDGILSGTEVCFQIAVSTNDFFNKNSNVICVDWMFNNFTLKEISSNFSGCTTLEKTYALEGSGDFAITTDLNQNVSGGNIKLIANNIILSEFAPTADGLPHTEIKNSTLVLSNEVVEIVVRVEFTNFNGTNYLSCSSGNNMFVLLSNLINVEFFDNVTMDSKFIDIYSRIAKGYYKTGGGPLDPD